MTLSISSRRHHRHLFEAIASDVNKSVVGFVQSAVAVPQLRARMHKREQTAHARLQVQCLLLVALVD